MTTSRKPLGQARHPETGILFDRNISCLLQPPAVGPTGACAPRQPAVGLTTCRRGHLALARLARAREGASAVELPGSTFTWYDERPRRGPRTQAHLQSLVSRFSADAQLEIKLKQAIAIPVNERATLRNSSPHQSRPSPFDAFIRLVCNTIVMRGPSTLSPNRRLSGMRPPVPAPFIAAGAGLASPQPAFILRRL